MATVSLSEMRQRARELADQETGAPSTAFVDDPELDRRINEALSAQHDLMVELQRHEWVISPVKTHPTNLALGTNDYPLPDDVYIVLTVRLSQSGYQYQVHPFEHADRAWLESVSALPYIWGYRYRVVGRHLKILPDPRTTYELFVDYIPEYKPLNNPDETFECPYGWWRWAALKVAIDMVGKRKSDTTHLITALGGEDRRIRAMAGKHGTRGLRITNTRKADPLRWRYPRLWRDT